MTGYFVTGTDTGVGKTFVSCALAAAWRAEGRNVGVFKPAETGCEAGPDGLVAEDADRLLAACGSDQTSREVCPVRFPAPAAPLVAAEAEGASIDLDELVEAGRQLTERFEPLIVEGAGGLLVPLGPTTTYADFARALGLPVIVVVGSKLGCLNHALLTFAALEAAGQTIAGFVLNEIVDDPEEALAHQTHREMLRRFSKVRDLGHLPHATGESPAALAREHLDLDALLLPE